jgi:hypothetical protein
VVIMRRNIVAGLFLIIIVSLYAIPIYKVDAPPTCYGYTCGLISALATDIRFSYSTVNASIIPDYTDGENLTHIIEITSSHNITNIADHEVSFLTSYVRSSWTPHDSYSSILKNITIEGNPSLYKSSITNNLSTPEDLPEGIGSRYPSGFFSSFVDSQIDVVNLTVAAHAEIVLSVHTILIVKCLGHYFDIRYGLDMQKLRSDSTQLDGGFDVSNTSLLLKTVFLNSQSRSVNPVGDSLIATWSISDWDWDSEAPYPGLQIDEDVFSEYIGVQLCQSEYLIPTIGHWLPGAGIQLFFAIPVITLLALLVVWYRLVK